MGMRSTVSGTQRKLEKAISKYLLEHVGEGAEGYPGALFTDIPELFMRAYETFEKSYEGDLGDLSSATIRQLISGAPAYTFKPGEVSQRWEETYAGPVMESWRENVLPAIKESFNLPGVLYSRARGEGIGAEASKFYGQYVAPSLFTALQTGEQMGFQSKEAAAGRQMQALGLPTQLATQKFAGAAGVTGTYMDLMEKQRLAQYQEWLRTRAEPGWAAGFGATYMTDPTMTYVQSPEFAGWADYLSLGLTGAKYLFPGGAAADALAGPAGGASTLGYTGGLYGYGP